MKLTIFLLTAAFLNASANTIGQTITVSGKNMKLENVFSVVEKQTGFVVFATMDVLTEAKPVTLSVREMPLADFMEITLKDQGLTYEISNQTILISKIKLPVSGFYTPLSSLSTTPPVTGIILDAQGKPLGGVNVVLKGTKKGVASNADGSFSIDAKEGDVLVISSVGFAAKELKIGADNINNIVLQVSTSPLDEVQIIAYGKTTRRLSTGNVSSVKAEELEKQPTTNPLLGLQGRVPGLVIEQQSGYAGSGVKVRIQGQNSIGNGNEPLYVIDGVPYGAQALPQLNVLQQGPNPMSFINPADIESIDVLKDADATAIYGSRAANGAILITTKKGKVGATSVDINMQTGFSDMKRRVDMMNTQQYIQMRKEAFANEGLGYPTVPDAINYDLTVWDTSKYTNWQDELLNGTAHYNDVQGSVSGGNSSTQYFVGVGYHKETTIFRSDMANQKGSVHFSITNISPNQRFKMQFSGSYQLDNNRLIDRDLTEDAVLMTPNAPAIYNPDGSLNWAPSPSGTSTWRNPMSYLSDTYKAVTKNLIGSALFSYNILPGLDVKSSFGYTDLRNDETRLYPLAGKAPEELVFQRGFSTFANSGTSSWIIEPQATYTKLIGGGKLDLLAGASVQANSATRLEVNGMGYTSDLLLEDLSSAPQKSGQSSSSMYKYNAVFGRVNFNWADKYIVSGNIRRDGSSRFGSQNMLHNFASIAGAWIFSKERIFESLSFLSFGKLNASYGTTGNDQIGDYTYLSLYNTVSSQIGYQSVPGLSPLRLSNPYLQWEETRKLSVGLDLGFLKDRILLNTTYYRNRSSNQLLGYSLPVTTGFGDISTNFPATVQNYGLELSLNVVPIRNRDFTWTANLNFTLARNKLIEYKDLETSTDANRLIIGQPITIAMVYDLAGVDPVTGLFQFNKAGGGTTLYPDYFQDRTVIIDYTPKYYGGLQNSFRFKGLQLDFLFQYAKQVGIGFYYTGSLGGFYGTAGSSPNSNQPITVLDRWKKPGDVQPIQKVLYSFSETGRVYDALQSDDGLSDASYVRLKNVSLSWQIPATWSRKAMLKNLRFYAHGQNLLTITNYQGLDPETKVSTRLPPMRVFTFGIQFTL